MKNEFPFTAHNYETPKVSIFWNGTQQTGLFKSVTGALIHINEQPIYGGNNVWSIKCPNGDIFTPTNSNGVLVL